MPKLVEITEFSPLLHDANCVYCHVDLELGDQAVVCNLCASPHHADCWEANRKECATFGCEGCGRAMPSDSVIDMAGADDELVAVGITLDANPSDSNQSEASSDGFVVGIIMLLALLAVAALMFSDLIVFNIVFNK